MAMNMVGDEKSPNIYFVTDKRGTFLVTSDFAVAYDTWRRLPRNAESSLEDRKHGTIATTSPESDSPHARLVTYDDSGQFFPSLRRNIF